MKDLGLVWWGALIALVVVVAVLDSREEEPVPCTWHFITVDSKMMNVPEEGLEIQVCLDDHNRVVR